jgi:hypothetical protein
VNGLGVEYTVGVCASLFGDRGRILKAVPSGACTTVDPCYIAVGTVPVRFVGDGFDVTIPLSFLGNSDGRLNFKVLAVTQLPGARPTAVLDVMPDVGLPPGRVQ